MNTWFVKVIRSGARAEDGSLPPDVWKEGVVHPTLNLFDQGDKRAVVLVVEDSIPYTESSFANYAEGIGTIRASGGSVGYGSETLIVENEENTENSSVARMRGFGDYEIDDKSSTLKARDYKDTTDIVIENPVVFEPGSIARNAGPAGEQETAPTLRANMGDNQPAMRKGLNVRRLTPVECERLQGFPDDWTLPAGADSHRYKQMGNAVTVNVLKWIGKNL